MDIATSFFSFLVLSRLPLAEHSYSSLWKESVDAAHVAEPPGTEQSTKGKEMGLEAAWPRPSWRERQKADF